MPKTLHYDSIYPSLVPLGAFWRFLGFLWVFFKTVRAISEDIGICQKPCAAIRCIRVWCPKKYFISYEEILGYEKNPSVLFLGSLGVSQTYQPPHDHQNNQPNVGFGGLGGFVRGV